MAITAVLGRATPNTLLYSIAHDGAAGDALTITNATLLADAVAGPLRDMLQQAAPDAATAARFLGGIDVGSVGDYINPSVGFADMTVAPGTGTTTLWTVAAGSDGADMEIDIGNTAVAAGLLRIEFKHTVDR